MRQMAEASEGVVNSAKRFLGALFGLARIETGVLMKGLGARARGELAAAGASIIAWAWLSAALAFVLSRYFPLEWIALAMSVAFFVVAAASRAGSRKRTVGLSKEARELITKYSDALREKEGAALLPDAALPLAEDAPKEGRTTELVRELESAREEVSESSSQLKAAAADALNPVPEIRHFVAKHPGAAVLGGLAMGVLLGTRNLKRAHAHDAIS